MKPKLLIAGVVAAALALPGAGALAAEGGRVQTASGTVVAVTEGSKTIVIQSTLGGQPWIIGTEVTDDTTFAGRAKGLRDVKPGDSVTLRWVRQEQGGVARSITVR